MTDGRPTGAHPPAGGRERGAAAAAAVSDGGRGRRRRLLRRLAFWASALLVAAFVVYLAVSLWAFDQALDHPDRSGLDGWLCDPDRDGC